MMALVVASWQMEREFLFLVTVSLDPDIMQAQAFGINHWLI
jgi:hypothetical protein